MNITQIINNAMDSTVANASDAKCTDNSLLKDIRITENFEYDRFLMNFSIALLKSYHKALKEELSKNGIDI